MPVISPAEYAAPMSEKNTLSSETSLNILLSYDGRLKERETSAANSPLVMFESGFALFAEPLRTPARFQVRISLSAQWSLISVRVELSREMAFDVPCADRTVTAAISIAVIFFRILFGFLSSLDDFYLL